MEFSTPASTRRFFDIGAYLTTPTFKGVYDGIKEHEPDLGNVLQRSWRRGLHAIMIPGINFNVSREALEIAKTDDRLFCTVGCSPARGHEFDKEGAEDYLNLLKDLTVNNRGKVAAIGEIGLDYRWLEICDKDTQLRYFEMQLELAKEQNLPVFINARNSSADVAKVLKNHPGLRGVIHSFDGTNADAENFMEMGFYLGINGCSLRTDDNLMMLKNIPTERLLLESNSPWCLMKPLHAGYRFIRTTFPARAKFHWSPDSMVRGRNEPANVNQVLEVIAAVKEVDPDELSETIFNSAKSLFAPSA